MSIVSLGNCNEINMSQGRKILYVLGPIPWLLVPYDVVFLSTVCEVEHVHCLLFEMCFHKQVFKHLLKSLLVKQQCVLPVCVR